jgi:hypothetical protein
MADQIDLFLFDGLKGFGAGHVAPYEAELMRGQILEVSGAEVVDDDDPPALPEEELHEMGTNKAGTTGYQNYLRPHSD